MKNKFNNKKIFTYIIFFTFVLFIYDAFTNTYIVIRQDHENRITKHTGNCRNQGYGFYKKIINNYSNKNYNLKAVNFNDAPSPMNYFTDFKKKLSDEDIILIGANKKNFDKYNKDYPKVIYSENNCYYLKK